MHYLITLFSFQNFDAMLTNLSLDDIERLATANLMKNAV